MAGFCSPRPLHADPRHLRPKTNAPKAEVTARAGGLLHHGPERLHRRRDVHGRAGFRQLRPESAAQAVGGGERSAFALCRRWDITAGRITRADIVSSTTPPSPRTGSHSKGHVVVTGR
ncbi:MAG: hypothetical protein MZV64_23205 [Ignavibacteriales bacterium]|nr:hypothetical protein [Ignavibacteriales bacterium]